MRVTLALYRALLRLLPADFRAAYGAEMTAMLAARLETARGPLARAQVRTRAAADVVLVALVERRRQGVPTGQGPPVRAWDLAADVRSDVRFALRALRRAPAFTAGAVLTLGLGIGTVTALFTVVDGVLLQPLPWPSAERLALVNSPYLNPDNHAAWLRDLPLAEAAAAFAIDGGTLRTPDGAESVSVMPVGAGFLELTGARPRVGRAFLPADHVGGAAPVALVREDFWRRWWGEEAAVGRVVELDGVGYEVVGLLPADFSFYRYRDAVVWIPLAARAVRGVSLLARLPDDVAPTDARPALEALAERLSTPERRATVARLEANPVNVHGVADAMVGEVRSTLWMLLAAAAVVVLLAAANVGNLWAARTLSRREELAVRAALGAGTGRLLRQLVVEALLVALAGAVVGAVLAAFTPVLLALAPDYLPRAGNVGVGLRALAFAGGVGVLAALLFGVAPALAVARRTSAPARTRGATAGRRAGGAQSALVVAEVAAALVLVTGAALLARTYDALRPDEPGFRVEDRLVASFNLSESAYPTAADRLRFAEALMGEVGTRGAQAGAVATDLPLTGMSMFVPVPTVDGGPPPETAPSGVHFRAVSAGYFALMEVPLLAGRGLVAADVEGAGLVAVVNESAARRMWGEGVDPIGRTLTLDLTDVPSPLRVVGVVRDGWILRGPEPRPEVYASFAQLPFGRFHLVVDARDVTPATLRGAVRAVDPMVPIRELAPLEQLVSWSVVVPRFQASVLGALTTVALFLAAMGCFAVLSQMIGRRRRELGIRMALGASGRAMLGLVLARAARLAALGIVAGAGLAWAATRVLEAHLYGVAARDPATLAGAAALLGVTVLAAALLPALRAARLEPVRALEAD